MARNIARAFLAIALLAMLPGCVIPPRGYYGGGYHQQRYAYQGSYGPRGGYGGYGGGYGGGYRRW
ncbi:MAG: hypothetical protein JWR10_341 [Rubritepida sp.]|nr:hypothetical protein [Rubritepida sp.]